MSPRSRRAAATALAALAGGALALMATALISGRAHAEMPALTARDLMTPECRKRVDWLNPDTRPLVRPAADYEFDEVVRRNLARLCGPDKLWGRLP